jgi:hypothetical protein
MPLIVSKIFLLSWLLFWKPENLIQKNQTSKKFQYELIPFNGI